MPLSILKRFALGKNYDLKTSSKGIEFIQSFEELRLDSYLDQAGVWTIGWGTTKGVTKDMTVTKEAALRMFLDDLRVSEEAVRTNVKVRLKQHQFDALVSFTYNCGVTALRVSTLLKVLNSGNYDEAPVQMSRWVKVKDPLRGRLVTSNGLVRRRKAEGEIFSKGVYNTNQ